MADLDEAYQRGAMASVGWPIDDTEQRPNCRLRPDQGNLLELSIQAMRARATVGELSDALEKVFGRHRADIQKVTGVYAAAYDSAEGWEKLQREIAEFGEAHGRRPRFRF